MNFKLACIFTFIDFCRKEFPAVKKTYIHDLIVDKVIIMSHSSTVLRNTMQNILGQ